MKLGKPNGAAALRRAGKGGEALRETVKRNADGFARSLAPVVEEIRAEGAASLRDIARALKERGVVTRRGARWHVSNVRNILGRLALPS